MAGSGRTRTSSLAWWQTALMVVGAVALASVLGALFLGVGDGPPHVMADDTPEAGTEAFLHAIAGATGAALVEGGTVQELENGDGFFPDLLASLEGAQESISLSVFIWMDGTASDQVLDVLLRKQREGVQVRILLDALGSKSAPEDRFAELERAGAEVATFRSARFGKLTRIHRRNHRRAIVIDGRVGYIGGIAVADSWLGDAQDAGHWRDSMFRLTGPLARQLQGHFADHWVAVTGKVLDGDELYPQDSSERESGLRSAMLAASPAPDAHPVDVFMAYSVLAARERVWLTTPYFAPSDALLDALKGRAQAGADVRVLVPGKEIDNKTSRWVAQNYYEDLMEAGVKVYEYEPTFMHAKTLVVDGEWSVIGSANQNSRSRKLDEENLVGIQDEALAMQLQETFLKDLERSEEIRLDEWRRRSPFARFLSMVARAIEQQS